MSNGYENQLEFLENADFLKSIRNSNGQIQLYLLMLRLEFLLKKKLLECIGLKEFQNGHYELGKSGRAKYKNHYFSSFYNDILSKCDPHNNLATDKESLKKSLNDFIDFLQQCSHNSGCKFDPSKDKSYPNIRYADYKSEIFDKIKNTCAQIEIYVEKICALPYPPKDGEK
jgi:hypothetical protein